MSANDITKKRETQRKHTEGLREWRKKQGFVRVEVWVHRDDRQAIINESVRLYNAKMQEMQP
jgi:hypothetical protein